MSGNRNSLFGLLIHRPPMVLLADVISVDGNGSAKAVADVSEGSMFCDRELGGVPACVAIEYMAQTVALVVGENRRSKGEPPKVGFLLGTRKMDVAIPAFKCDVRYEIEAKCAYVDDEFGSFDCTIADQSGEVVATASLTAFQPPGDSKEFAEKMGEMR